MADADFWASQPELLKPLQQFVSELKLTIQSKEEYKFQGELRKKDERIKELEEEIRELRKAMRYQQEMFLAERPNPDIYVEATADFEKPQRTTSKKKYGEIRPGVINHEDVRSQFNGFFAKHRRQYGGKLIDVTDYSRKTCSQMDIKLSVPCYILKLAFEKCKKFVIQRLTAAIIKPDFSDQNLDGIVYKLYDSTIQQRNELIFKDHRLVAVEEITKTMFSEPPKLDSTMTTEDLELMWDEKKAAYSLLLNSSNIDQLQHYILDHVTKVIQQDWKVGNTAPQDMISEAVNIAFSMVTLVPPALICLPDYYNEEWVEPRTNWWKVDPSSKMKPVIATIYFRPTLFLGSFHVGVGVKGEVGNVVKDGGKHISESRDSVPDSRPAKSTRKRSSHSNISPAVTTTQGQYGCGNESHCSPTPFSPPMRDDHISYQYGGSSHSTII